jgi:hypothetical protein
MMSEILPAEWSQNAEETIDTPSYRYEKKPVMSASFLFDA